MNDPIRVVRQTMSRFRTFEPRKCGLSQIPPPNPFTLLLSHGQRDMPADRITLHSHRGEHQRHVVQPLFGHSKVDGTIRDKGGELEEVLGIAEGIDISQT